MKKILLGLAVASLSLSLAPAASAQKFVTRSANISFFSKTPVEDIEGINHEVSMALNAATGDVQAIVPVRSFKFKQELMQEHFNENYMESDKFPKAQFKGKITNISQVDFNKDGVYVVKALGNLTIHGVTHEMTLPGTVTVKNGAVTINSPFQVKCADYGIKIPSVVSTKVAETINVTMNGMLTPAK